MKVFAQGSALLLKLRADEDLVEALEAYSGEGALWVDGAGTLRDVELEDAEGEVRKIGSVEAISIRGVATPDEVELHGTLMRGAQALGGRLRRARVVRCVLRGERFVSVEAADAFSTGISRRRKRAWFLGSGRRCQRRQRGQRSSSSAGGWRRLGGSHRSIRGRAGCGTSPNARPPQEATTRPGASARHDPIGQGAREDAFVS